MIFSTTHLPKLFYVYLYLREDGTPYYVGKGKGRRAWMPHRTKKGGIHTPSFDRIQIVAHKLSENESHILETRLISQFGRKDLGTGVLRNGTDGGEGTSGQVRTDAQIQQSVLFAAAAKDRNNKLAAENKHPFQNSDWHKTKEASEISKKTAKAMKDKNNLGFQQGHASIAGSIGGKIGGKISGKLNRNQVGVIFKDGSGARIDHAKYISYKDEMIQRQVPIENWEFVAVRSNEAKKRKLNIG